MFVLQTFEIYILVIKSQNVFSVLIVFISWCFKKYIANKRIEDSRGRHENIIMCQVVLIQYNFSPISGTWPTLACLWTFETFFFNTKYIYACTCVYMYTCVSFVSASYFHRISLDIFALSWETKVLFLKDESPFPVSMCHYRTTINTFKLFSHCLQLKLNFSSRLS